MCMTEADGNDYIQLICCHVTLFKKSIIMNYFVLRIAGDR